MRGFVLSDDLEHCRGIRSLFERRAKALVVQELGDSGQGVQMFLKLPWRDKEKQHEANRLSIQGVKVNPPF